MIDDLMTFLNARLDEDQAAADAAACAAMKSYWLPSEPSDDPGYAVFRAHICRYDPERAFREIAAKRAHLDNYQWGETTYRQAATAARADLVLGYLDAAWGALLADAEVWNDHPDYRDFGRRPSLPVVN